MTHLTIFHKSPTYAGAKISYHLLADIKDLAGDIKSFKNTLKNYLHVNCFSTVDEFFMHAIR
jgi:hypothetical protein